MQSIYREYDIRGIFGEELTEDRVKKLGFVLGKEAGGGSKVVAIGYDARTHSPKLFEYLASGFNAAGLKVLKIGMCPTPVSYYAGFQDFGGKKPDLTVMITGSHNPPEYNGFKITIKNEPFFGEQIYALGRKIESCGEAIATNAASEEIDAVKRYIAYMSEQFAPLKGLKTPIAFDIGNGVAAITLAEILKNLQIEAKLMFPEPDGTFPNHHPDPSEEENLEMLKEEMRKSGYKYGFAFDGDADRIAMLSHKNNFKGDILSIFLARHIKNPVVIGEVKCSQVMYDEINKFGKAIMYKTGHSNLKVKIKETNASFAAEVSGHLFFNDRYFGYDDAVYAAFRLIELIAQGFDFDGEAAKLPKVYSTDELKVKTTEDEKFKIIDRLREALKTPPANMPKIRDIIAIDGVRVIYETGWGLVRASNTTPVLVTRFEATSEADLAAIQTSLTALLEKCK
ncbi:MAG: phosphomannomutase/phosphoglucomutase [Helicobacteraceae bacterium]|jgi:phosphomannomutase/phosphoglucomutase|nr:phosphomannomutase/phosphoglucomutase [Helicobacteraceae bacterium]